jgi:hypothetical protein
MKCGQLGQSRDSNMWNAAKDIRYCYISGNRTGRCVTNSVPFGWVLKAFARVFVIEENRCVHQQII